MIWTQLNLYTSVPQLPKILNTNFLSFERYIDVFYDGSLGILTVPLETTGRIKGTKGEFVTAVVDNLIVKKQFTNLYDNNTTADYNWYRMIVDPVTVGRDPCTYGIDTSSWKFPYEPAGTKVIDVQKPYYKINNLQPYFLGNNNLSQVVGIYLDDSIYSTDQFKIILDPCSGSYYEIDSSMAGSFFMDFIATSYDPSWGSTWETYKYGVESGGGSGGGTVGPGTLNYLAMFDSATSVGDSPLHMVGSTLYGDVDLSVGDVIIHNALRDSSENILIGYGSPLQINDPLAVRDVCIYGPNAWIEGLLITHDISTSGDIYVDGSIMLNGQEVGPAIFDPTMDDGIEVPENVGGIPAGTTVGDLRGKTLEQIIVDMLFPTVLAYIGTPKSFALNGVSTVTDEVGTSYFPSVTAVFNQGLIKNGNNTDGPALVGTIPLYAYMLPDSTLDATTGDTHVFSPYNIIFGANVWSVSGTHAAGTGSYYDNKGNEVFNLDGSRVSALVSANSATVTGRRYAWRGSGATGSAPATSIGVRALTSKSFLNALNAGTFTITIPAGNQDVYFYIPSGKTVVVQYVESSYADVTGSFVQTPITVNDAAGNPQSYTSYVSHIGDTGYPVTANYLVTIS